MPRQPVRAATVPPLVGDLLGARGKRRADLGSELEESPVAGERLQAPANQMSGTARVPSLVRELCSQERQLGTAERRMPNEAIEPALTLGNSSLSSNTRCHSAKFAVRPSRVGSTGTQDRLGFAPSWAR